jgi:hypothetical protein
MLSTKLVYLALVLGVLGAPLGAQEETRSVNSLNGGKERPVWVERDVNSLNGGTPRPVWVEGDVNSLNGGTVRPVWVERDVNSLNGGAVRPVWVERDVNQANDGWVESRVSVLSQIGRPRIYASAGRACA